MSKQRMLKKPSSSQIIRHSIQVLMFVLVYLTVANHALAELGIVLPIIGSASVHAICPFGGVVTLYTLLTTGQFVQKIHESAVVLLALTGILAVLAGPVFCGWICPLGSIQEWIGKLGRKIWGRRYNNLMPKRIDRVLGFARYAVLAWVVYVTATSGKLLFSTIDPYNALMNFWSESVAWQALVILGLTLLGSLFIERPWCRYACPMGALLGLSNTFRIFSIRRKASTCVDCGHCDKACPMGIDLSCKTSIRDTRCITCLECTSENACPKPDTLALGR